MKNSSGQIRWSWVISYPILLRLIMIMLTFPYMFIYSNWVNTGETPGYYEQYVFENRAWISTFLGLPVFYLACYFMGLKIKDDIIRNCMYMVSMYILMDIPLEWAVGDLTDWRLLIAHSSKLVVGYWGASLAQRKFVKP